jgi:hypothetical protein
MKRPDKDADAPERNAASNKPLAGFGHEAIDLRRRARAVDQLINDALDGNCLNRGFGHARYSCADRCGTVKGRPVPTFDVAVLLASVSALIV